MLTPSPADLDSLASALGFAYLSAQLAATTGPAKQFIPLVLTAHADLYLRPENVYALDSAGLDPGSLLCIDDLPRDRLAGLGAGFALVDHNRLLPMFGTQGECLHIEDRLSSAGTAMKRHYCRALSNWQTRKSPPRARS